MVDSAYSVGIDYDLYRQEDFYEPPIIPSVSYTRLSLRYLFVIAFIAFTLITSLIAYTLTCIPYFDIKQVSIVPLHSEVLPPSIITMIEGKTIGSSMYSPIKRNGEKLFIQHPLVKHVTIQRGKNRTIAAYVEMNPINAIFVVNQQFFGLIGTDVISLSKDDFSYYTKDTIQITSASLLESVERESLITLLTDMEVDNSDIKDKRTTVSEIYFPSLHLTLRIRESISYSRLHYVLQLIRLEREKSLITNISLHSQVYYDVYQNSLIMDERR